MRSGILVRRYFPVDAEYSILVRVRGNPAPNVPASHLDIRLDGKRVQLLEVNIDTAEEKQYTRNQEVRLKIAAGMHEVVAGWSRPGREKTPRRSRRSPGCGSAWPGRTGRCHRARAPR